MEANKNLGYAALSKLPDRSWAVQIAKELRAETALDDEINKLLTVRAEKLAQNNDAIGVLPENFSQGS
jgi:hypothetical protein